LKVIDYSNNQSLEFDASLKPLVYGLIGFLLIELLIIFLFFIFKGVSAYVDSIRQKELESVARELFILSFIIAFGWFIASVLTLFVKRLNLAEFLSWSGVVGYILDLFITIGIIKAFFSTEIKNLKMTRKFIKHNFFITILFLIILSTDIFFILVPQYLLTGSYSIEDVSPPIDNPDMLTFTMKEKGITYNLTEAMLIKLNSSYPGISNDFRKDNIDYIIAYRNTDKDKQKTSCYLWVTNINKVWYLNIINISNLSSGTYLLVAVVRNDLTDSSTIGVSKRIAQKLFYIPPERAKANYSYSCTQTS
jgi:hypothetical protein